MTNKEQIEKAFAELSKAAENTTEAMKAGIDAIYHAAKLLSEINSVFHQVRIRQQEIKNLRIKEYTLGLTYLERQRLNGE